MTKREIQIIRQSVPCSCGSVEKISGVGCSFTFFEKKGGVSGLLFDLVIQVTRAFGRTDELRFTIYQ